MEADTGVVEGGAALTTAAEGVDSDFSSSLCAFEDCAAPPSGGCFEFSLLCLCLSLSSSLPFSSALSVALPSLLSSLLSLLSSDSSLSRSTRSKRKKIGPDEPTLIVLLAFGGLAISNAFTSASLTTPSPPFTPPLTFTPLFSFLFLLLSCLSASFSIDSPVPNDTDLWWRRERGVRSREGTRGVKGRGGSEWRE